MSKRPITPSYTTIASLLLALVALLYSLAAAQTPPVPQAPTSTQIPEWVVKYANNQETAARACAVTLAQEQAKVDELTKQLADAKKASSSTAPAAPAKP